MKRTMRNIIPYAASFLIFAIPLLPSIVKAEAIDPQRPRSHLRTAAVECLFQTAADAEPFRLLLAQNKQTTLEEEGEEDQEVEEDVEKIDKYFDPKENGEIVSIGQDRVVREDETIDGDVVVVGANLTLYGRVEGDAVCVGGDLIAGPKATIRGDLVNVAARPRSIRPRTCGVKK